MLEFLNNLLWARNRVGIGLSYRRNRFLGNDSWVPLKKSLKVPSLGLDRLEKIRKNVLVRHLSVLERVES